MKLLYYHGIALTYDSSPSYQRETISAHQLRNGLPLPLRRFPQPMFWTAGASRWVSSYRGRGPTASLPSYYWVFVRTFAPDKLSASESFLVRKDPGLVLQLLSDRPKTPLDV